MKPFLILGCAMLLIITVVIAEGQNKDVEKKTDAKPDAKKADAKKTDAAKGDKPKASDDKKGDKKKDEPKLPFKTIQENAAYGIGLNIGKGIKEFPLKLDTELVLRGIRDAASDKKPLLTEEQFAATMKKVEQIVNEKALVDQKIAAEKLAAEMKKLGEKNLQEGKAFLAENKKKPGVQVTKSGLQYKVLKAGSGKSPKATDIVKANYKGTFIDGKVFDSSQGTPVEFPLNRVISGWTEGVQLMKVGAKWQLFLPADLAYGEQGSRGAIGPNATLVFEIELVGITPQDPPKKEPTKDPKEENSDQGKKPAKKKPTEKKPVEKKPSEKKPTEKKSGDK